MQLEVCGSLDLAQNSILGLMGRIGATPVKSAGGMGEASSAHYTPSLNRIAYNKKGAASSPNQGTT